MKTLRGVERLMPISAHPLKKLINTIYSKFKKIFIDESYKLNTNWQVSINVEISLNIALISDLF